MGYVGEFGPGLRSLSLALYYGGLMSQPKVLELYRSVGVQISDGCLSNLLVHHQEVFHAERDAVLAAGLGSSPWQHLDDTSTRVNGQHHYAQVLCNPLYTAYRTTPSEDRLSVILTLANWEALRFRVTEDALAYLAAVGVAPWVQAGVAGLPREQEWEAEAFGALLTERLPGLGPALGGRWVQEAAALAAYRAQTGWPVVQLLECDDAPQFKGVTAELGARQRVRKGDVSFGPRTPEGAQAWDTFQTLAATAQKLEVSFYHYVQDTLTGAYQMPRLADLITARAQKLNLGASWNTPKLPPLY